MVLNKFKAPDGTYEDGLQVPGSSELAKTGTRTGDDLERNNPLSLDQNVMFNNKSLLKWLPDSRRIRGMNGSILSS